MEHNPNIIRLCEEDAAPAVPSAAAPHETSDLAPFDPVALAARHDGWTPERQRAFIEELADCGIVREAAARVGMSERSARRLRRRPDAGDFNRAWDQAVRIGGEHLRSIAWDRAVNGTIRRRYFRGEVIGEERVFNDRLLIYLLGRLARLGPAGGDVAGKIEGWGERMGAVEGGLPEPDEDSCSPVWCDDRGAWLTNFPPPPDFDGEERGNLLDADYCRTLSPDEAAKLRNWNARGLDDRRRQRDRYFDRLG